jgi:hypothetical protein
VFFHGAAPVDVDDVRPGDFIEAVYAAGERIAIVNRLNEWRPFLWHVRGSDDQNEKLSEYLNGAREGAWYQVNPVTGTCLNNSWRAEANLTSFRYVLLESDKERLNRGQVKCAMQRRLAGKIWCQIILNRSG